MKKILFIFLGLALFAALAGCGSKGAPTAAPTATASGAAGKPTPTTAVAQATPANGFVSALYNNPPVYLYAGPNDTFTVLGQLLVDQNAQLLGTDPNNQWFLIKINGITGWVHASLVIANIAQ